MYDSEDRSIRLALGGDILLTRRLKVYHEAAFLRLRGVLNEADACFANFESVAHRYEKAVAGVSRGSFMITEPGLLDDLVWFGVDMVSCANNHALDFGEDGVLASIRHLDRAGIVHAGSGRNLREAQSPAYLDTPAGRVALVAAAASWQDWHRAEEQRPDMLGKPGVSSLRFDRVYEVDRASLDALRAVGHRIGVDRRRERDAKWFYSPEELGVDDGESYSFLGQTFRVADAFAVHTTAKAGDLSDILRQVREARRQADWVIVSLHFHEFGGSSLLTADSQVDLDEPAEFVTEFARAAINAGGDVFVGHGPHRLLGAEVFQGKPIFYSLGNLVMESDTTRFVPAHAYERFGLDASATPADFYDRRSRNETQAHPTLPDYWESIVPVCVFREGDLIEVELHPIDLGFGRPRSQRGRPVLADADLGATIVDRFERLSNFGVSGWVDRTANGFRLRWGPDHTEAEGV